MLNVNYELEEESSSGEEELGEKGGKKCKEGEKEEEQREEDVEEKSEEEEEEENEEEEEEEEMREEGENGTSLAQTFPYLSSVSGNINESIPHDQPNNENFDLNILSSQDYSEDFDSHVGTSLFTTNYLSKKESDTVSDSDSCEISDTDINLHPLQGPPVPPEESDKDISLMKTFVNLAKSNYKKKTYKSGGKSCSACTNYYCKTRGMGVSYYSFPRDEERHDAWYAAIKTKSIPNNPLHTYVCSEHFLTGRRSLLQKTRRNLIDVSVINVMS